MKCDWWCLSDGHDGEAVGTSKLGLAERVGFEPTVELPRQQFSRLPDSAALAPLRCDGPSICLNREAVMTTRSTTSAELTVPNGVLQRLNQCAPMMDWMSLERE